jgi:hypothetical protein
MFRFRIAWRNNVRPILIVAAGWIAVHVHHPPFPEAIAAEVLLLRKQLAYYQDHQIRPRLLTDATRLSLVLWSRLFDWKEALAIVTPATFVRWHHKSFKLYWPWKSRGGRRRLPKKIRQAAKHCRSSLSVQSPNFSPAAL